MDKHELLRLIDQAAREGWTSLDLSNQDLTELPPKIWELTNLKELRLRYNQLTTLSPEIGKLNNLIRLDIGGSQLTTLPHEIGDLKNLRWFFLRDNQLSYLPSEIWSLPNLEERLDLGNNQLTEFPPDIKSLTKLRRLHLDNNKFSKIPDEIGELESLINLYLGNNQLTMLPPKIGQLKNLKHLSLSDNQINLLPREIGALINLTFLSLKNNQLIALPSEIENLKSLTILDLRGNPLPIRPEILETTDEPDKIIAQYFLYPANTSPKSIIGMDYEKNYNFSNMSFTDLELNELPIEIWKQTTLTKLILRKNQLSKLPSEIEKLRHLRELDLQNNQLSTLPQEIENLKDMISIRLGGNQFTNIPSAICALTNLVSLDFEYNQLTQISPEIKQLIHLRRLYLKHNRLRNLPSEMWNLTQLTRLELGYNQLTSFPPEIENLSNLKQLELQYNHITTLPSEISRLRHLEYLNLRGNLLPIPPEILELTDQPKTILNYYFEHQHGAKKPLHEVKVLIVGQGAVGKTSLIKRLLDDSFNPHETKTDGITINQWHLPVNDADIRLNLWDFGGQEIMHATHQFFLTKRSLYVLVLDSRLDEQNNRVEYWLKIIQSFGGDSPIIVVCNKCDEHSLDLNWKGLQEKYPTIKAFAKRLSCKTGEGLMELRSLIAQEVGQLPHLNDELLLTWFAVKTKLEEMEANYIGYNEYQQMCEVEQVTDELSQQTLLGFLHDLGIVLHFHDHPILEDTNVLNPEWVTRGIYQIVNSNELFQRKGELERSALTHILPAADYPRSKHQFILDMMRKFELCFDFAESAGERFLVPDLLSREEPYTGEWGDSLAFQYHYDILPGSVISRFMVRMHAYIHQKTYWRNGVVLISDDGQNRALIKADTEDRKIFIHISGRPETRSLFLAIIRADFRKIHATIPKLNLKEVIPLPGHPDVTIDYADLLKLRERGITTYYYPKADAEINVNQLLDGLDLAKPKGNGATLPFAIQQQMIAFLTRLPNLHDPAGQRALVYSAGLDKSIQDQLQFGLPVAQFVPMLVTILSNHERLADGRLALVALLETARQSVGKDTRDECDRLLKAVF